MDIGGSTRDRENPSTTSSQSAHEPTRQKSYNDIYKSSTSGRTNNKYKEESNARQGYRAPRVTDLNERRRQMERELPVNPGEEDPKIRDRRKDMYTKKLTEALNSIEDVYGLRMEGANGKPIVISGINTFLSEMLVKIKHMSDAEKKQCKKKMGAHVAEVQYIASYLRFYNTVKLNFSQIEGIREVTDVLLRFLHVDRTGKNMQYLNVLNRTLQTLDVKNPKTVNSLGYRYIRVFVLLAITADLVNASIVAEFLLNQISLAEIDERNSRRRETKG
ncbi:hypothetical protein UT300012_24230 [Paraclostridium bifermentans]